MGRGSSHTVNMDSFFTGVCFCDLNVLAQESKKINEAMLQALAGYGYECVALSREVELAKKVQLKPASEMLKQTFDALPMTKKRRRLKVLKRLTVTVNDSSVLHALSSPALEGYDLLAIRPGTDKILQQACSVLNIDMISVDLTHRLPFNFKHTQIKQAVERGVIFEICYSPLIRDVTARRNTIANALELVKITKGKNIVVSSQAEKVFDIRAPEDVVNLCHLFGLSGGLSKATLTTNCRQALLRSEMRRHTVKGVVSSEMGVASLEKPEGDEREVEKPQVKGGQSRQRKRKAEDKTEQTGLKKAKS